MYLIETPAPCAQPKYKCIPYCCTYECVPKVRAPLSGVKGRLQQVSCLWSWLEGAISTHAGLALRFSSYCAVRVNSLAEKTYTQTGIWFEVTLLSLCPG